MKTKILLALFLAGVAALAVAQRPVACTAADAGEHVGEIATITGTVNSVHQAEKGNIFVNIGAKYTNQVFTAFIPSSSAADFFNPQQYEGKTVAVSGKIELYHGKPQIIVTNVSQIIIK
jgi:DNA/RNA endonuclease YhcR with UshA esterase domain